ncbi:hypothetical protein GR217_37165 [Rhizobium leguminosarum]|uniref:Uncharacterized protein n=1 Tax=Rhizobium ruizarguesonis TaxID=2081791 RepID=A0AAE5C6V7_9HYPH|nr:hypothetical protein [Rhizobium ruizarguesonis]NEI53220.1 hypothetical protein [Rhizobium ruizarguesonis]
MAEEHVPGFPGVFDGYLLQWKGQETGSSTELRSALIAALDQIPEFSRRKVSLKPGWFAYDVTCEKPLQSVPGALEQDTYRYVLLMRIQGKTGSVIVASSSRLVAKGIIDQFINRELVPNLLPIQLLIGDLARELVFSPDTKFKMTSFSGDFIHDGADVRTMILYGDDLGNANFVKENIASVTASQVGVRERTSLREDARIGASGNLRFYYRDGAGLSSLEACLAYVNELNLYVYS